MDCILITSQGCIQTIHMVVEESYVYCKWNVQIHITNHSEIWCPSSCCWWQLSYITARVKYICDLNNCISSHIVEKTGTMRIPSQIQKNWSYGYEYIHDLNQSGCQSSESNDLHLIFLSSEFFDFILLIKDIGTIWFYWAVKLFVSIPMTLIDLSCFDFTTICFTCHVWSNGDSDNVLDVLKLLSVFHNAWKYPSFIHIMLSAIHSRWLWN